MEKDDKCANHGLWMKNFRIAYWGLFVVGFITFVFTDRELAGLAITGLGYVVFLVSFIVDVRHASWHVKQSKEGEDNE